MTSNKQHLIKAIKEMNIDAIDFILEDHNSYFDAPKELFIAALSKKFAQLKSEGVFEFDKVTEGTCESCFRGCPGYSFLTKNDDYLDLLIEEDNGIISDLTQCTEFKNETEVKKENRIFLYISQDFRTSYNPSPREIRNRKEIESAEAEFKELENSIVNLDTLEAWQKKWNDLFESVKHLVLSHSFVGSFISTFYGVKNVLLLRTEKALAELAMAEFKNIKLSNEKELIDWLIKFKENELFYGSGFDLTENWKQTSLLLYRNREPLPSENLNFYENIILDINGYQDSVEFSQVYNKYYFKFDDEVNR